SLLGEFVSDFKVDVSRYASENVVSFSISLDKRGRKYSSDYQVFARNKPTPPPEGSDELHEGKYLRRVSVNPTPIYIDVKGGALTGNYYTFNPMSESDSSLTIDTTDPKISMTAYAGGNIDDAYKEYSWEVSPTFTDDWITGVESATGTSNYLRIKPNGYDTQVLDATGQTVNVGVWSKDKGEVFVGCKATYTEGGTTQEINADKGTAIVYLRGIKKVTLDSVASSNLVPWSPIYEQYPYVDGHSRSEVTEGYVAPGKSVSLAAVVYHSNVNFNNGVIWTLETKESCAGSWEACTDSKWASLGNPDSNLKINSISIGRNASNSRVFRITATSQFDPTKKASVVIGVLPDTRRSSGIGEYSRGFYTNMDNLYYNKDDGQGSALIKDILFMKCTKVDGAGEQGDSSDKVRIVKDENGDFRLLIEYDAFSYSGLQKENLYKGAGGIKIHLTIGYVGMDGKYYMTGQQWSTYKSEFEAQEGITLDTNTQIYQHDFTYELKAVEVTRVSPTNDVIVLEKGKSRMVGVTTSFYNLRAPRGNTYYFGAYIGSESSTSDMTKNLIIPGNGSLNSQFSVSKAFEYGDIDEYVDQAIIELSAKAATVKREYLTDPMTLRLTADDYYRISPGAFDKSFTWYKVITANVEGAPVYIPTKDSTSTDTGLSFPGTISTSESSPTTITGLDTNGNTVTASVYKSGVYYKLKYNAKTYTYNTTYKYWKEG
ncbi:MAG: hypothetical protein IK123_04085, partial [Lachnospiraceae bacterium]|nr:hypothetical protein [Lachnospiraceae bacterium]